MSNTTHILNSPTPNLCGHCESDIYGALGPSDVEQTCFAQDAQHSTDRVLWRPNLDYGYFSNGREAMGHVDVVTHSSIASRAPVYTVRASTSVSSWSDAASNKTLPRHSSISPVASGVICWGASSYKLAISAPADRLN